jgi:hypothetical protein
VSAGDPLAVLRRVREGRPPVEARPAPGAAPGAAPWAPRSRTVDPAVERCDLCGDAIPEEHPHLVDVRARSLLCACRGCSILFAADGSGGGHYRSVPDRWLAFPDFRLSRAGWEALQIPVSVAFFFRNSELDRVAAFYPGPAGATESLLSLEAWDEVVAANPALASLAPDVEAFLVRTGRDGPAECFLVPIDACYELVGHLRRLWRGFDGGREAHAALDAFFARVRGRARAEVAPS